MKNDIYRTRRDNPPQLDEAGLIEYFKTQPDIAAAYLFGSMATGKAHPQSDIDIALLLTDVPGDTAQLMDRETQLSEAMRPFMDRDFDLVILNKASLTFCQKILVEHKLLYARNHFVRVEFQMLVMREYAEVSSAHERFARLLLELTGEQRPDDSNSQAASLE